MTCLTLFAFGVILGIIPCIVWGRLGGDETLEKEHPRLKKTLHLIHHAYFGIALMIIGALLASPLILGWGTGTALDDLLFHSFSSYFQRRKIINS